MTKEKKLDLALLNKADAKYKTKEVKIPLIIEGKTQIAVLEIDEVFRPSKIKSCVEEFVEKMDFTRKIDKSRIEGLYEVYLIFLIIKNFSSFPAPSSYTKQIKVIQSMIDNNILFPIYSHFNPIEIAKINDEVRDVLRMFDDKFDTFMSNMEGLEERLEDSLENPDLLL